MTYPPSGDEHHGARSVDLGVICAWLGVALGLVIALAGILIL